MISTQRQRLHIARDALHRQRRCGALQVLIDAGHARAVICGMANQSWRKLGEHWQHEKWETWVFTMLLDDLIFNLRCSDFRCMIKKIKFLSEQHNGKFLDELWGLGTVSQLQIAA